MQTETARKLGPRPSALQSNGQLGGYCPVSILDLVGWKKQGDQVVYKNPEGPAADPAALADAIAETQLPAGMCEEGGLMPLTHGHYLIPKSADPQWI